MKVTIKDVAEYAGVGVGTVSRVLNDAKAVNESTRARVKEAIAALEYHPNRMGSRLRKNETKMIALMVPIIDHPFFAKLAHYVDDEADLCGYTVMLASSQHRTQKEREIIERIRRREMDGAIFVTHYAHNEEELKNCPIVSLDRHFGDDIPYVTSDNYDSTRSALNYLIQKGCKRIGYVGSRPLVESDVMERERAYLDVMKENGMQSFVCNEHIQHGEEANIAGAFLREYPHLDGIFASGYTMALAVHSKAAEMGIAMPEQMQLVAYDGSFEQWGEHRVITSVEQPIEEIGRTLVRTLIDVIRGKKTEHRIVLPSRFHPGSTTF